ARALRLGRRSRARPNYTHHIDLQSTSDRRQRQCRCSVARDHQQLDSMRRQEASILNRITLNGCERLRAIRDTSGITKIDEPLVGQMLMQRAIDGQSADAAIEDADG